MTDYFTPSPSSEYADALDRIAEAEGTSTEQSKAAAHARRLPVRFDDEIEQMPPLPWLAEGILPANALAALYGPPGAGKSFVALDLALSIAARVPWFGRSLREGTALYLAAEGLAGLSQRIRAWKAARAIEHRLGVGFVTMAVDLLGPATIPRVVDASRTLHDQVELVVVDTLARSMVGDENDTGDMSKLVAHADAIRRGTGATVLLVHHTRKDSDLERGSSALRGAVDTLLLCRDGDDGRELVCEKQKDAEQFTPIPFRLVAGHGSCIVQASVGADPSSAREQAGGMTPKRCAVLRTLCDAFTARGATTTEWVKASGVPERTFFNVRTWLWREGYVTENGLRYTPTPSGKTAAAINCHSTATVTATVTAIGSGNPPASGLQPLAGVPRNSGLQRNGDRPGSGDDEMLSLLAEVDERLGQTAD